MGLYSPLKRLHRMLLHKGNPGMENLVVIHGAVGIRLNAEIEVRTLETAQVHEYFVYLV